MADAGGVVGDVIGYDVWASRNQDDKTNWRDIALHLGRQLAETPAHLSRVLYIPRHDRTTLHLALCDVSTRYTETVGESPIGSSKYTVKLGLMQRPRGDGSDDIPIAYTIDFKEGGVGQTAGATVQYQGQPTEVCPQVDIDFNTTDSQACCLTINRPDTPENPAPGIPVAISYPIPPSKTRDGTFKHPYYTFCVSRESGLATFEWQIHPVQHGSLRYTLIRVPQHDDDTDSEVCAIYHHMGLGASLSQSYSEGVLLMSPSANPEIQTIIVSSALGMLSQLRDLTEGKKNTPAEATPSKDAKKLRLNPIKRFLTRKR